MQIDTKKIEGAIFKGTAQQASDKTGVKFGLITQYRAGKSAKRYRDWRGMSLKEAGKILNRLDN